jgi:O-acetyl-ADP-ribose deacetylase (regulator of RNase III)
LAKEKKLATIAFPNISTGVYGFPKHKAALIATESVTTFLKKNKYPKEVIFVCFDDENYELYRNLLGVD